MATKEDICRKIEQVIPEAGRCGIDYSVEYDKKNHAWTVDLQSGQQHLKTFIEDDEAQNCVDKDRCIPVGLQIGQLKRNLRLFKHS